VKEGNMRFSVALAFIIVCVVWGSTYLAIRFVIETAPPFFTAGTRWAVAGILLYAVTRLRGAPRPSRSHWFSAIAVGGLMLLAGHGAVVWAEQWIPSGLTSILVATVPMWVTLVESVNYKRRPDWKVLIALLAGFAGVIILVEDMPTLGQGMIGSFAAVAILLGALAWGSGSFYSRTAKMPDSHFLGVAMQMIVGGVLLFSASFVTGELTSLQLAGMSPRSLAALVYLIVFGSLIAFTSYIWLLKQIAPSRVATYAYINPVVALLLGLALAGEQLTFRSVVAAIIILISVAAITTLKSETTKAQ
jgi:drug/metabolite transporter (DMT)-like permease